MDDAALDGTHGTLRLGDSLRFRGGRRPDVSAFVIALFIHAVAAATFLLAGSALKEERIEYQTVAVHLVSPPPTVEGPPAPVETTQAVVTTPKVEPQPVEPVAKPKPQTQSAVDQKVVSKPTTAKPAVGANAKPGPVGGEGLNMVQEGVPFPYPDYLKNVILRLSSSLRWQGAANLTAEVGFYIRRDGSVGGVKMLRESGNLQFDLAAIAAVENAGRAKAMGPLPREWQGDRLPISFTFVPNN